VETGTEWKTQHLVCANDVTILGIKIFINTVKGFER